ncbi:hypothetical protein [Archangium sp.]|uniref:M61 family metallopeptidase n=1 Tax=Archangium sp. TaxID=1872627 RepID=UPI002D26202F|nr:hypothetical protein [Archangium sp.]HYO52221.1 hypothetical protein [Archangium sp.]
MKLRGFLALAALPLLAAAAPPDTAIQYSLSPSLEKGELTSLVVELRFTGDADGETRLRLPEAWGGKTELWRQVRDVAVEGATVREDGPAARLLTHAPQAPLLVRYRVVSAYAQDPTVAEKGNPYAPIVRPRWFSVLGTAVFAEPEGRDSAPAGFRWGPLPEGWTVASDLDHIARGRPSQVGDVLQSVAVGAPDLKVVTREVAGTPFRFAALGPWRFDVETFTDLLARVLSAQRDYWHDPGESYFVALSPLQPVPQHLSLGGTGLDDSFSLYAGTNSEAEQMRHLVAHEYLHTWNASRLGGLPEADEALDYWFSEGFTDFLTSRLLLRSGVWSLEEFVERLNQTLGAYASSPVRDAPNARIGKEFWSDPQVERLPYQRGMLLAFLWEERLRKATRGRRDLDDVLLAQLKQADANERQGVKAFAAALFPRVYRETGGPELSQELERYVERGEPVRLPSGLFGSCARLVTRELPVFDRGFDGEATRRAGNVVTGVRPDSPAYAVGLRDGMTLVKREAGKPGDSRVGYVLRVDDHGTERLIRYQPEGKERFTTQEVLLTPGLTPKQRAACTRSMSGS